MRLCFRLQDALVATGNYYVEHQRKKVIEEEELYGLVLSTPALHEMFLLRRSCLCHMSG